MKKLLRLIMPLFLFFAFVLAGCGQEQNQETIYHTVEFVSDGNTILTLQVADGTKITRPADPQAGEDMLFDGWYVNGEKWIFSVGTVTENLTLQAMFSGKQQVEEKIVPVYQGMSAVALNTNVALPKNRDRTPIEDIVPDIDVEVGEGIEFYATKGENYLVLVHIYNPSSFEILSFTLNEYKYQSYEFKDGSNSTQLIVEVTAPQISGITELTIDAIKYIDGTEIKDVQMDGEKTIKVGVKYENEPSALLAQENIGGQGYMAQINVKDDAYLLKNATDLNLYYTDGSGTLFQKQLNVGTNLVMLDNLKMNTIYQYVVVGIYDCLDGKGKSGKYLLKQEFLVNGYEISDIAPLKEEVTFNLNKVLDDVTFTDISLYNGNELAGTYDQDVNHIYGLLSNTEYRLAVNYTYTLDGELTQATTEYTFTTLSKLQPNVRISSLTASKKSVDYLIEFDDEDAVMLSHSASLYLNDNKVATLDEFTSSFTNLLSNNNYELRFEYTYDLNDGFGIRKGELTKAIQTQALVAPTVELQLDIAQEELHYDVIVNDVENIYVFDDVRLYQDDVLLVTNKDGNISNLKANNDYVMVVNYHYDLNDGNGIINDTYTKNIHTAKKAPTIELDVGVVSQDNVQFTTHISDENITGAMKSIKLFDGDKVVGQINDGSNYVFEGLESNKEYRIEAIYQYDLNDGHGNQTTVANATFTTYKQIPEVTITSVESKTSIYYEYDVNDKDNIFNFVNAELFKVGESIEKTTSNEHTFANLLANSNYKLVLTYEYDANDGLGVVRKTSEKAIRTYSYTIPEVEIIASSIGNTISFETIMIDEDMIGTIENVKLYQGTDLVEVSDSVNDGLFTGLRTNVPHTIEVTYSYDLQDGSGKQERKATKEITTGKSAPDIAIIVYPDTYNADFDIKVSDLNNTGHIEAIELYKKDGTLVKAYQDLSVRALQDLNSFEEYQIAVTYQFDLDDGNGSRNITKKVSFTTLKEAPTVAIETLQASYNMVDYSLDVNDRFNSITKIEVKLYKDGRLVSTSNDADASFTNLLSGNDYVVNVEYSYDLENGNGIKTETLRENIKTNSYTVPTMEAVTSFTDSQIRYETVIKDSNDLLVYDDTRLYRGTDLVAVDYNDGLFDGLKSNTEYRLVVNYHYDLNDGTGIHYMTHETVITTANTRPTVSISPINTTQTTFEFNTIINDPNISGRINNYAIYKDNAMIEKIDEAVSRISNLLPNTEYVIKLEYIYDLDDGTGFHVDGFEYGFITLKQVPTYQLVVTDYTKNSISFNHVITDVDEALTYESTELFLNNELVATIDNVSTLRFANLLSNTNYKLVTTYYVDLNNGKYKRTETTFVTTLAMETPLVDIDLDVTKDSVSFEYEITDLDNIGTVDSIELYKNGIKVSDNPTNNTFANLLSDNEYEVVINLLCDFHDGNGAKIVSYRKNATTLKYMDPYVDMGFFSTSSEIEVKPSVSDLDNVITGMEAKLYDENGVLVAVKEFNGTTTFEELQSNTRYTVVASYSYDLHDGNGTLTREVSKHYSTLASDVSIVSFEVLNSTTPKTNEMISFRVNLENESRVQISYIIVNGEVAYVTGGDQITNIVFAIDSGTRGGTKNINVESFAYYINDIEVLQNVSGFASTTVEVLSRLDIESFHSFDGSVILKNAEINGYVVTIDNPEGLDILTIDVGGNNYDVRKIDNYHYFFSSGVQFDSWNSRINSIKYTDADGNVAVRNYTDPFNPKFVYVGIENTYGTILAHEISTPEDLLAMESSGSYVLTADIDMTGYAWTRRDFNGYFDGRGHTIKNLSYVEENEYEQTYVSLFTTLGGTFTNVYFDSLYISVQSNRIHLNNLLYEGSYSNKSVSNVLFNGGVLLTSPEVYVSSPSACLPEGDNIYVVGSLLLNGSPISYQNTITLDEFNDNFKLNTLGWNFAQVDDKVEGNYKYTVVDNSYVIIKQYIGNEQDVVIPETLGNLPVAGIADLAFKDAVSIQSIDIPSTIYYIGSSILNGCNNIVSVSTAVLPNYRFFSLFKYNDSSAIPTSIRNVVLKDGITEFGGFNGSNITSVSLPEGITTIPDSAFAGCNRLASITIPNSVTRIESFAFNSCGNLKEIVIPENVTYIGDYVFSSCQNLRSVIFTGKEISGYLISDTYANYYSIHSKDETNYSFSDMTRDFVEYNFDRIISQGDIDYALFTDYTASVNSYNGNSSNVVVPNSINYNGDEYVVKSIGQSAFRGNRNLQTITLPESLESINRNAFYDCDYLREVTIPRNVTYIGTYAFSSCDNLRKISFEDNSQLKEIDQWAFHVCWNINCILELPEGLEIIRNGAFANSNFSAIIIPSSVKEIGNQAFADISGKIVVLKGNVDNIATNAFSSSYDKTFYLTKDVTRFDSSSLNGTNITETITNVVDAKIDKDVLYIIYDDKAVATHTVSSSSNIFIDGSINYNGKNYPVEISSNLTSNNYNRVYTDAAESTGLLNVFTNSNSKTYGAYDLITDSNYSYVLYLNKTATIISNYNSSLLNFVPSQIEYKGEIYTVNQVVSGAFSWNDNRVIYTDALPSSKLLDNDLGTYRKFYNVLDFVEYEDFSVVLHKDNTATIYRYNGSSLEIAIPEFITINGVEFRVTSIHDFAISYRDGLVLTTSADESSNLLSNYTASGIAKYYNYKSLYSDDTYDYLLHLDGTATITKYNGKDRVVTIPQTVTFGDVEYTIEKIDDNAFNTNSRLTDVTLPETIKYIGNYAFNNCNNLKTINLPDGLLKIGKYAFNYCLNLQRVTLPESLEYIDDYAFSTCQQFYEIIIPKNVTYIGYGAFGSCYNVNKIMFAEDSKLETIGDGAFHFGGNERIIIDIPSSVKTIGNIAFGDTCARIIIINGNIDNLDYSAFYSSNGEKTIYVMKDANQVDVESLTNFTLSEIYYNVIEIINKKDVLYAILDNKAIAMAYVGNENSLFVHSTIEYNGKVLPVELQADYSLFNYRTIYTDASQASGFLSEIDTGKFYEAYGLTTFDGLFYRINTNGTASVVGYKEWKNIFYIPSSIEYEGNHYTVAPASNLFGWASDMSIYTDASSSSGIIDNIATGAALFYGAIGYLDENDMRFILNKDRTAILVKCYSTDALAYVPSKVLYDGVEYRVTSIRSNAFDYIPDFTLVTDALDTTNLFGNVMASNVYYNIEDVITIDKYTYILNKNNTAILYKYNEPTSVVNVPSTIIVDTKEYVVSYIVLNAISYVDGLIVTTDALESTNLLSNVNSVSRYYNVKKFETIGNYAYVLSNDNTAILHKYNEIAQEISIPATITVDNQEYVVKSVNVDAISYVDGLIVTTTAKFETRLLENIMVGQKYYNYKALYSDDAFSYNIHADNTASIIGYVGQDANVVAPQYVTYDGEQYLINEIGENAFANNANITSVSLPDSVTIIGNRAFGNCTSLESFNVPANVSYIGYSAFSFCTNLATVTFADNSSLTRLNSSTFEECTRLSSINLPNSLEYIDYNAFSNCTSLKEITIPANVEEIASSAFSGCTKLADVTFETGSRVTRIEDNMFSGFAKLVSITLPDNLEYIGNNAFSNCTVLKTINIPASVSYIGSRAFYECMALTTVTFADNSLLKRIENYTFTNCNKLSSINLPNSLETIGNYAFNNCDNLSSITIPENVITIGNYALSDCENLLTVTFADNSLLKRIEDGAFNGDFRLSKIDLPSNLKYIGNNSFTSTAISSLTIPSSVEYIGSMALAYTDNLMNVYFLGSVNEIAATAFVNQSSWTFNGAVYTVESEGRSELEYVYGLVNSNYGFVCNTTVGNYNYILLNDKTAIFTGYVEREQNVVIPYSVSYNGENYVVTEIAQRVFSGNKKLKTISLPSGLETIGKQTFQNSTLQEIIIPANVSFIGGWAFSECYSLSSVVFENNSRLATISESTFANCGNLMTISLPDNLETIERYGFQQSAINQITIPASVTSIGERAFEYCHNLRVIIIKSLDVDIYSDAFSQGYSSKVVYLATDEPFNTLVEENTIERIVCGFDDIVTVDNVNYILFENSALAKSYVNSAQYVFIRSTIEYNGKVYSVEVDEDNTFGSMIVGTDGLESNGLLENINSSEKLYNLEGMMQEDGFVYALYSGIDAHLIYASTYDEYIFVPSKVTYGGQNYNVTNVKYGVFGYWISKIIYTDALAETQLLDNQPIDSSRILYNSIGLIQFDEYTYVVHPNNKATLVKYNTNASEVSVPEMFVYNGVEYQVIDVTRYAIPYKNGLVVTTSAFESTGLLKNVECSEKFYNYKALYSDESFDYLIHSNNTATILSYNGSETEIVVPEYVTYEDSQYVIVKLGDNLFANQSTLTKVTLPNSIEVIGNNAFGGCSRLADINMPQNLKVIGNNAFNGCARITEVILPDSVTRIGNYAFNGANRLSKITISDNSSLTFIGDNAFYNCIRITSINLPSNLEYIGSYAFQDCDALTSITIPANVETIGRSAFQCCDNLATVTFEDNSKVKRIEETTFASCGMLSSINLPNNLEYIGQGVFYYVSITTLVIPSSVQEIESGAFCYAYSLKTVYFLGQIDTISEYSFCDNSNGIFGGTIYTVEAKGHSELAYVYGLENIVYNYHCNVEIESSSYILLSNNTAILTKYNRNDSTVTIPESLEYNGNNYTIVSIGNSAFAGKSQMTSITLPNTITSIGKNAFEGCRYLTSIVIPDSVSYIGIGAFQGCSNLTSVTLPEGLTEINDSTFLDCYSLINIVIPSSVRRIGNSAFSSNSQLSSITLNDGLEEIGNMAFYNSRATYIIIPSSVMHIGENAFGAMYNLTGVYLEGLVESINNAAFNEAYDKTLYLNSAEAPASYSNLNRIGNIVCGITGMENRDGVIYLLDSNGNEYILG